LCTGFGTAGPPEITESVLLEEVNACAFYVEVFLLIVISVLSILNGHEINPQFRLGS
jgi:hypothetical protein